MGRQIWRISKSDMDKLLSENEDEDTEKYLNRIGARKRRPDREELDELFGNI